MVEPQAVEQNQIFDIKLKNSDRVGMVKILKELVCDPIVSLEDSEDKFDD